MNEEELRKKKQHYAQKPVIIVFHERFGRYIRKNLLGENELKLLFNVAEMISRIYKTGTTKNIEDKKKLKVAEIKHNRKDVMNRCNINEKEWESAIKRLTELELMWVNRNDTTLNDMYSILRPKYHYPALKEIFYHTKHSLRKFHKENRKQFNYHKQYSEEEK